MLTVVVLGSLTVVGVFTVSAIFGTVPAGESHTVTNESLTQDVGNWTQVDETYGENYSENVTVYNSSDAQLSDPDFDWEPSNQSVRFYNTSNTSAGASASISYAFDAKPRQARQSVGVFANVFMIGSIGAVVSVATVVLGLLPSFGRSGRRR